MMWITRFDEASLCAKLDAVAPVSYDCDPASNNSDKYENVDDDEDDDYYYYGMRRSLLKWMQGGHSNHWSYRPEEVVAIANDFRFEKHYVWVTN